MFLIVSKKNIFEEWKKVLWVGAEIDLIDIEKERKRNREKKKKKLRKKIMKKRKD